MFWNFRHFRLAISLSSRLCKSHFPDLQTTTLSANVTFSFWSNSKTKSVSQLKHPSVHCNPAYFYSTRHTDMPYEPYYITTGKMNSSLERAQWRRIVLYDFNGSLFEIPTVFLMFVPVNIYLIYNNYQVYFNPQCCWPAVYILEITSPTASS